MQALNDIAKRRFVCHGCGTVSAILGKHRIHAVKFAVMFFALESVEHFLHEIINKKHFKLYSGIIYRNRQIVCDIITECANGAVVVRFHPLTDKVRKAVNQHFCSCFLCVREEQILSGSLRKPILGRAEAPRKCRLNGG